MRAGALGPALAHGLAATAHGVEADPLLVVGVDLEAGGEDQAVDRVLDAVDHHRVLGDGVDAAAVGVDEVTLGWLNAGRYSSWKQTRLQFLP